MASFFAALLSSLDIALLLFIIAIGLNIIFGVLNIVNFAHGALYMLGAYVGYSCIVMLGMPFWLAIIVAPFAAVILAIFIERCMLRFVYNRDVSDSLLLTFALMLIINESIRLIWGTGIYIIDPPNLLTGTFSFWGIKYPKYSVFVIVMGLLCLAILWWGFNRTRLGRVVRAAAMDRDMAQLVCINTKFVITAVFAFGAWLAAAGGVIAAPMRAIDPGMGDKIIIESFIIVVIGGLGNFSGTLIGAMVLGLIHGFGGRYFPEINLLLPFIGMALVLLFKPYGLMGGRHK
ncbi:branched-chain amino acid ABC transporter permease [Paenalcaligenes sp. Me131]|uniref:branched-chain amino acid ABC transporter permease n=1 Tax=Paenalcaligenes sp. Me131 TaxID=3392636 RepID=UPI003D2DA08C